MNLIIKKLNVDKAQDFITYLLQKQSPKVVL